MDCAEFVCRVMADDNLTDNVKHMNVPMLQKFLDANDDFESSMKPQIGDIAKWEGHTGIVTAVNNKGEIKLTHASNSKVPLKENTNFASVSAYSNRKFVGFYRPKNESYNTIYDAGVLSEVITMGSRSDMKKYNIYFNVQSAPIPLTIE